MRRCTAGADKCTAWAISRCEVVLSRCKISRIARSKASRGMEGVSESCVMKVKMQCKYRSRHNKLSPFRYQAFYHHAITPLCLADSPARHPRLRHLPGTGHLVGQAQPIPAGRRAGHDGRARGLFRPAAVAVLAPLALAAEPRRLAHGGPVRRRAGVDEPVFLYG